MECKQSTGLKLIPKTKLQLADEFGVNVKTIFRYCKTIGIVTDGKMLSIPELKKFYKHWGVPQEVPLEFK